VTSEEAHIGRRAIALPVLMVVRVINVFVFAAGAGALVAGIVSRSLTISVNVEWAASLLGFALTLAFVFISASVGAVLLMPAQTALVREIRGEEDPSLPAPLVLLLVMLCGAAALQAPALRTWWIEDRALLHILTPGRSDPLGLELIPAAILFSMPVIAAATLVLFTLTSLLAIIVPAKLAWRALASCVALQAGLVVGGSLMLREVHTIGTAVLPLLASADNAAASGVAEWVARHDLAAATTDQRVPWIFCGYLVALALAWSFAPSSTAGKTQEFASAPVSPPPELTGAPQTFPASSAAAVFDDSNYSVRARMTMLESMFIRRYSNYDICTIPPTSRAQFSFSWRTGILRREPNGPDLLAVVPPRNPGLFRGRQYEVVDAATRENLASLVPRGSDWEIVHPSGSLIARVLQLTAGRGFASYHAMIGDDEVCKFKWALQGLTVLTAELEVEFGRDQRAGLDRGLAMILAPILEQQARLVSERARIT
jgi:hypothetical protein